MPSILLASQVPPPVLPAALLPYIAANSSAGGNAPALPSFAAGMTVGLPGALNQVATAAALGSRYGGGGYGILTGLEISAGVGLTVSVAVGQAMIDGPVELDEAGSVVVPDNTGRVWIWLLQTGAIAAVATLLDPPDDFCCLLGSCVTNAGSVTSVDSSGVVYLRGSCLWRETADTLEPSDDPGDTLVFTRTLGGLYVWDGSAYMEVLAAGSVPRWAKKTVPYGDFAAAATSKVVDLFTLPAGAVVHQCKLKHSASFTGGAVSAATIKVGTVADDDAFLVAFNVFQAPSNTAISFGDLPVALAHGGTTVVKGTLTTTSANTNALTSGSVDIWILYSVPD